VTMRIIESDGAPKEALVAIWGANRTKGTVSLHRGAQVHIGARWEAMAQMCGPDVIGRFRRTPTQLKNIAREPRGSGACVK
jgi:hypothetical protein